MKSMENAYKRILILPDIRSAQNVGSLFRTADACGIQEIYLVGITPAPTDKFGRANSAIAKTALGAEQTIPWKYIATLAPLLTKLKKENVKTIAIEQSDRSIDYKKVKGSKSVAFILGNEVDGLPKKILDRVDIVAEIPMSGKKESLNVSVAGGIALFRILNI
ncbi:MAG TPA: TrmH family RNA methyltransferase [Candidatus Paceibacterota bacterium]|jgi:tRNA G18 (ribose-2'-O)-methylase SpoU|nr:TrmH family RNA methyltransferase [Candidatus Paceibacterota bacterium]